jgi:CBS domain-containing protein
MKATDAMSSPVIFARPQLPVRAAAALLVTHGFSAVPVVDDDENVVGIATEADMVRGRITPDGWKVEGYPEPTVADVMTEEPVVASPDDDLADLVAVMLDNGFRSIPVVDRGRLVGVVSRRDVLRLVAHGDLTREYGAGAATWRALSGVG